MPVSEITHIIPRFIRRSGDRFIKVWGFLSPWAVAPMQLPHLSASHQGWSAWRMCYMPLEHLRAQTLHVCARLFDIYLLLIIMFFSVCSLHEVMRSVRREILDPLWFFNWVPRNFGGTTGHPLGQGSQTPFSGGARWTTSPKGPGPAGRRGTMF